MAKIRVIVKRPDEEYGHMTNISPRLENLQKIVGGYIETVSLTDKIVIICNEKGKLRGLEPNLRIGSFDVLVGTIIVCGIDGDDFGEIPIDFKTWKKLVDDWQK